MNGFVLQDYGWQIPASRVKISVLPGSMQPIFEQAANALIIFREPK